MTPVRPNPSVRDVIIGRWEPNSYDDSAGIDRSFPTTVNILYGSDECGANAPNADRAVTRMNVMFDVLIYFGGQASSYGYSVPPTTCASQ